MEDRLADYARIGDIDYPLVRCKLKAWFALDNIFADTVEAAEFGNRENLVSSLYSYVSAAFSIPIKELQECPWYEITRAFREAYAINRPTINLPMLRPAPKTSHSSTKEGWDYPERLWYIWINMLAKAYGWNIEYIENLDVDIALALLQEIAVDDQLEKEFFWGLSETSYSYDEVSKRSKFVPMDRPHWMKPTPKPIQKVKIKASELPVGIVLKWNTDTNEYTKSQ